MFYSVVVLVNYSFYLYFTLIVILLLRVKALTYYKQLSLTSYVNSNNAYLDFVCLVYFVFFISWSSCIIVYFHAYALSI
jgi:hypothetical protein